MTYRVSYGGAARAREHSTSLLFAGNLNDAPKPGVAKEAALIELYRQQKLTQLDLSVALGITRLETEALLKIHNVTEHLQSLAEYDPALSHLRKTTVG